MTDDEYHAAIALDLILFGDPNEPLLRVAFARVLGAALRAERERVLSELGQAARRADPMGLDGPAWFVTAVARIRALD